MKKSEALEIIAQKISPNWSECQHSRFCTAVIWSKAERILKGEDYINMLNTNRSRGSKITSKSALADIKVIEEVKKDYKRSLNKK